MKITHYFVFFASMVVTACASQNINEDPLSWGVFETEFQDILIKYYMPPEGKIFRQEPKAAPDAFDDGEPDTIIGFFGYDYGFKTSDNISDYWVFFGIGQNVAHEVKKMDSEENFEQAILGSMDFKFKEKKYTTINKRFWLHFSGLKDRSDVYYTRLNDNYYMYITGSYKIDIRKNPELHAKRRLITRKIVEQVQLLE